MAWGGGGRVVAAAAGEAKSGSLEQAKQLAAPAADLLLEGGRGEGGRAKSLFIYCTVRCIINWYHLVTVKHSQSYDSLLPTTYY